MYKLFQLGNRWQQYGQTFNSLSISRLAKRLVDLASHLHRGLRRPWHRLNYTCSEEPVTVQFTGQQLGEDTPNLASAKPIQIDRNAYLWVATQVQFTVRDDPTNPEVVDVVTAGGKSPNPTSLVDNCPTGWDLC
jgi:hypothetical protein